MRLTDEATRMLGTANAHVQSLLTLLSSYRCGGGGGDDGLCKGIRVTDPSHGSELNGFCGAGGKKCCMEG